MSNKESFDSRSGIGKHAESLVDQLLVEWNCFGLRTGVEDQLADIKDYLPNLLRKAMAAPDDPVYCHVRSMLEREIYSPDRLWYHREAGFFCVEVKGRSSSKHGFFTLDVDALRSYRQLHDSWKRLPQGMHPVAMAFADVGTHEIVSCWVHQIAMSEGIYISQQIPDFQQRWDRIGLEWPGVPRHSVPNGGSGKPYVKIHDFADCLLPFDQFFVRELLKQSNEDASLACNCCGDTATRFQCKECGSNISLGLWRSHYLNQHQLVV